MKVGGNVHFRQAWRVDRAERVAQLVVDPARQDEAVALDPEQCTSFGQAFYNQRRGIEQAIGNVADTVSLVLQGLAVDRLVQAQAQLRDPADCEQRRQPGHHEGQRGQQVECRGQVTAPLGLGHFAVAGDDEVSVGVAALTLTFCQGLEHIAAEPRVVFFRSIVDVVARRPAAVGGEAGAIRGQPVYRRVFPQSCEGGIQAAEVETIGRIGEVEVLLQRLALERVLALAADPVLELDCAGELQQR
ncbi:hypothetical protein D3C80_1055070 [compost metagenome]